MEITKITTSSRIVKMKYDEICRELNIGHSAESTDGMDVLSKAPAAPHGLSAAVVTSGV